MIGRLTDRHLLCGNIASIQPHDFAGQPIKSLVKAARTKRPTEIWI